MSLLASESRIQNGVLRIQIRSTHGLQFTCIAMELLIYLPFLVFLLCTYSSIHDTKPSAVSSQYVHLPIFIYFSALLAVYLFIYPSFHLSIYPSIHPYIYLSIYYIYLPILSIYLSVYLFIYLLYMSTYYIYLSSYVSIYLSIYLSMPLRIHPPTNFF
jgi:hypothetical protein